nr:AB-hydrolase lipase domain, alpha/beta hydrolase fold protein [Tanacetum cinerariifolium]
MAPKKGVKIATKKKTEKVVNPLFEKRPKQFGIGGALPPKKDVHRFVRWPQVVRIQRKRRILKLRLKVPPALNQFTKTLDKNLATTLFKMLLKYRPEDKAAKKERLIKRAQAESEGKTVEAKKPIVVKYGLNHITYLIEQNKAQLVIIAHDVDPIELVVWLPALCRKMEIPYCIVKGKSRLGTIVHQKTAAALCLTTVKNEDKMEFSRVLEAIKANFNDKYDEYRKKWGGGIMGSKSQAKTKAKERVLNSIHRKESHTMQRAVDNFLAVTKESVKTITYESLSNILRLINGISALLLRMLPGKNSMLEGMNGWELRPVLRGPRFPRWMEDGVSSFNHFVHELSTNYDPTSAVDYTSGDEIDEFEDASTYPASPLTPGLKFSRAASFKRERRRRQWIISVIKFIFLPARLMLVIPLYLLKKIIRRGIRALHTTNQKRTGSSKTTKKALDHVVQRATDRRRGLIEDLHLGIEIVIETIFDVIHYAVRCLISPLDTLKSLLRWSSSPSGTRKTDSNDSDAIVATTTLANPDPTPAERKSNLSKRLNTDARTCKDVITELGYPYEAINVVTSDGYVLLLERIPRRDSKKAVYLQHGVFDSSMCWVSNGIVGSPAFAAYDHGYDVFLGNFRGLVSREHVDKRISSRQYWRYSINEHGTKDLPALIEKINEVKTSELKSTSESSTNEESNTEQPYKLCAICHSLGGAAILMYIITRRVEKIPHRLSRSIMLSPAGFHHDSPFFFTVIEYTCLWLSPIIAPIFPGLYIPTRFFRMLVNKLARDLTNYPAVGGLVQTLMSYIVGGDSSNWVGVMGLPHYNMNDMPGVSFGVARHLAQIKRSARFRMFDYGSPEANRKVYGSPEPLDLGELYNLIDVPVDLVAGMKDKNFWNM